MESSRENLVVRREMNRDKRCGTDTEGWIKEREAEEETEIKQSRLEDRNQDSGVTEDKGSSESRDARLW